MKTLYTTEVGKHVPADEYPRLLERCPECGRPHYSASDLWDFLIGLFFITLSVSTFLYLVYKK